MERLHYAIECKEDKSELTIEGKPNLLMKLKNFEFRDPQDFSVDNLTHTQH